MMRAPWLLMSLATMVIGCTARDGGPRIDGGGPTGVGDGGAGGPGGGGDGGAIHDGGGADGPAPMDAGTPFPGMDAGGFAADAGVAAGDPDGSAIVRRMSVRGDGQMPALASAQVDAAGVAVVSTWIRGM